MGGFVGSAEKELVLLFAQIYREYAQLAKAKV